MPELLHPERDRPAPSGPSAPAKPKPPAAPVIRDITKSVFDAIGLPFSPDANNLVPIAMPTAGTFKVIDEVPLRVREKGSAAIS